MKTNCAIPQHTKIPIFRNCSPGFKTSKNFVNQRADKNMFKLNIKENCSKLTIKALHSRQFS